MRREESMRTGIAGPHQREPGISALEVLGAKKGFQDPDFHFLFDRLN